ncbi:MAG: efflux RND transporter periplasmic adaptor subunit [Syntrophobacteraceae bacterium]|nr:efflux RND transporter periplasmic adaptor subunit [Syntrophobacteraceae bacterium]
MSRIKSPIYPVLILLVFACSYFVYAGFLRRPPLPEGLIEANGRIEGDHVTVSSKFSGRIQKLLVREGDLVTSGQTVIVLDDTQTREKVAQANQAFLALREKVRASQMALEVLRKEVPLAIESATAGSARAMAVSSKAEAVAGQSRRDARRMEHLLSQGAVPSQRAEQSDLAFKEASDQASESRSALTQARKQLEQARLGWDRIKVREGELSALQAQLKQSSAALAEARSVLLDFVIKAPAGGVVLTRIANLGEMAAPGAPLLDLVDLDRLYLKVYIPEDQIGKVRVGLPARIHTDAFPDRPVPATVSIISSEAEFTPKEVQTVNERTKLVYGVKLYLDKNPDHFITPGMPCDAVIRWKKNVAWEAPRW